MGVKLSPGCEEEWGLMKRLESRVTCDSEFPELSNLRNFKESDRAAVKRFSGAEVKATWWWPGKKAKSEGCGNFVCHRWKRGKLAKQVKCSPDTQAWQPEFDPGIPHKG